MNYHMKVKITINIEMYSEYNACDIESLLEQALPRIPQRSSQKCRVEL